MAQTWNSAARIDFAMRAILGRCERAMVDQHYQRETLPERGVDLFMTLHCSNATQHSGGALEQGSAVGMDDELVGCHGSPTRRQRPVLLHGIADIRPVNHGV